jgi:hypothetical protein
MRKILLASTALVALTSVSAMAADVTISGGYNFIYQNDDKQSTTDAGSFSSEGDVNIQFSNTTDTGLTTTLNYGLHETGLRSSGAADNLQGNAATAVNSDGAAYDDLNASLSGDFGTLYFDPAGDDVALGGFDEKADKAGEGTDSGMASGYRGGILGASGTTIGYKLPTIVDGLTIALSHGEAAGEYFGYGIGYDAGMFSIGYVAESTNTVDNKVVSVGLNVAGISFGADQVTYEDADSAAAERKTVAYGASYTMDAITLAYEIGSQDNENTNAEEENHKQVQVSYAVAPGITAIVSSSEVDAATNTNDKEVLEVQLKLSF